MIVVDPDGNLFEERRKEERRKDKWVEELKKDLGQED